MEFVKLSVLWVSWGRWWKNTKLADQYNSQNHAFCLDATSNSVIKYEEGDQGKVREGCVLNSIGSEWNGREIPLLKLSTHFNTEMDLA